MWVGISGAFLFRTFLPSSNPFVQWLDDPQAWHGAHGLITGTPFFLFLVFITVVFHRLDNIFLSPDIYRLSYFESLEKKGLKTFQRALLSHPPCVHQKDFRHLPPS